MCICTHAKENTEHTESRSRKHGRQNKYSYIVNVITFVLTLWMQKSS